MRSRLHRIIHGAEQQIDKVRSRLRKRLGGYGEVVIVPYRGFGTRDQVWLKGRVLEAPGDIEPSPDDTVWHNMIAMYRRFESDELPRVPLRARWGEAVVEGETDEEGYYDLRLAPPTTLDAPASWHEATVELAGADTERVSATAEVLIPPSDSRFGVISDVDDTVLKTGATSLINMMRTTVLHNARTRLPFKGVSAFYRALVHQGSEAVRNPLFFVSSSPWNLYDFLVDFLEYNDIPRAPILLRDLGIDEHKFIKSGHGHKVDKVERILKTYPDLPFILIGDSGQEDPELYQEVIAAHPGRILAVYIRDVSVAERDAAVTAIAEAVRARGVEMLLVPDTLAAAEHAAAHGYIDEAAVEAVRTEINADT